jgi:tetratricopeptide (TPR) repeat protein
VARGRILHTRYLLRRDEDRATAVVDPGELELFLRAASLYRELGDPRGEGEATFWVGCFHQVARGDNATAVPLLERSLELASRAGDQAVTAEALRHLGIAAHAAGDLDLARQRLEESTRLRREAGQLAGAAANLVGLTYIAAAQERRDDALALLDEAGAIAEASQAQRIAQQVSEARATLGLSPDPEEQVRGGRGHHRPGALEGDRRVERAEQRSAPAEQDRDHVHADLIDQAERQRLLHDGRAVQVDGLLACGLLRLLDRAGHAVGHEGEHRRVR